MSLPYPWIRLTYLLTHSRIGDDTQARVGPTPESRSNDGCDARLSKLHLVGYGGAVGLLNAISGPCTGPGGRGAKKTSTPPHHPTAPSPHHSARPGVAAHDRALLLLGPISGHASLGALGVVAATCACRSVPTRAIPRSECDVRRERQRVLLMISCTACSQRSIRRLTGSRRCSHAPTTPTSRACRKSRVRWSYCFIEPSNREQGHCSKPNGFYRGWWRDLP